MCGICGTINFGANKPVIKEEVYSMTKVITHRGPDEDGFYFNDTLGLGMRRLKVIDLTTGKQPIHNENSTLWVVFNGEIYNYKELRGMLLNRGHTFYTSGDTEVLVHMYEEFGPDFLEKLCGMFAIALWDDNAQTLLVARDRIGKKPLYYHKGNDRFDFSSEMKSLLQLPSIKREIDFESFDKLLTLGYVPTPLSILKNINKLMPGHYLLFKQGDISVKKYWELSFRVAKNVTEEEYIEKIKFLFKDAVRKRLISDVPLGAFLSGGIDSSAVVAMMSQLTSQPVKTFSIGFEEDEYSELEYARITAKQFGTDHHELVVHPQISDLIPKLVWHFDEPFFDASAVPTYYVSELARQYVTVALSGDGGDELFAGYNRYVNRNIDKLLLSVPERIRRILMAQLEKIVPVTYKGGNYIRYLKKNPFEQYLDKISLFSDGLKEKLYSSDFKQTLSKIPMNNIFEAQLKNRLNNLDNISKMQYIDIHTYLPDDILTKVDKTSMAVSLEVRVPLLDHIFIEYVSSIPSHLKLKGDIRKYIFKKAMGDILPKEILSKKKAGFGVPIKIWLKKELKNYVNELLQAPKTRKRGYFNPQCVDQLLHDYTRGYKDYSRQIWSLVWLEIWHRTWID